MLSTERLNPASDALLLPILRHLQAHRHQIKAISFDFFDTLVHRLCNRPPDLFLELGRRLRSYDRLRQDLLPVEYRRLRQAAEQLARAEARQKGKPDVSVLEIRHQLSQVETSLGDGWYNERETEVEMCWPNSSVFGLVHHARHLGLRLIITSDIYLPSATLIDILRASGLNPDFFEFVLASNEHNAVKSDGSLFKVALQRLGIAPHELVHIGDNAQADIKGAESLGIKAFHYESEDTYFTEVIQRERAIAPELENYPISFTWLRLMAQRTTQFADSLRPYFDQGVFNLGPVMARYADWAVDRFVAAGVTQILAPMREGELMGELLVRAAKAKNAPLKVHVFYMSRRATALASVGAATVLDVHRIITNGLKVSNVGDAFRRLGLEDQVEHLTPEAARQLVTTPGVMQDLLRRLCTGPLAGRIQSNAAEKRAMFMDYLTRTLDEPAPQKIGLFDLGWGGTIQSQLRKILKLADWKTKLVGCYVSTDARAVELYLNGDEVHSYVGGLGSNADLNFVRWQPEILEAAISVGTGPAVDYTWGPDGRGQPVLGKQPVSDEENLRRTRIRQGILEFQSRWLDLKAIRPQFLANPIHCGRLDVECIAILRRLVEFPTSEEAEIYGGFGHDHGMIGEDNRVDVIHASDAEQVKADGAHVLFMQRNTMWRQGLIAKLHPGITEGMAKGWMGTRALGALASWATRGGETTGFLEEELRLIEKAVLDYAPQQIVLIGGSAMGNALWAAGVRAILPNGNEVSILEISPTPLPRQPRRLEGHQRLTLALEDATRTWMKLAPKGPAVIILEPSVPDALLPKLLERFNEVTRKDDVVIATHGNAENYRRPDEVQRSRDLWVFSQMHAKVPALQRQARDSLWTLSAPFSDRVTTYLQTRERPLLQERGKCLWRAPLPPGWVQGLEKRGWNAYEIDDVLWQAAGGISTEVATALLASSQPTFVALPMGPEAEPWASVATTLGIPVVTPQNAAIRLAELERLAPHTRPSTGPIWTVLLAQEGTAPTPDFDPQWVEFVLLDSQGDFPVPRGRSLRLLHSPSVSSDALRQAIGGTVPALSACSLEAPSHTAKAHIAEGETHYGAGDVLAAFRAFSAAIEASPHCAEAWNNLGVTLLGMGKTIDAIDALDRALAIDPTDLQTAINRARLGWTHGATGQVALTLRSFGGTAAAKEFRLEGPSPRALLLGVDRESIAAQVFAMSGWRCFPLDPQAWKAFAVTADPAGNYVSATRPSALVVSALDPDAAAWRSVAGHHGIPVVVASSSEPTTKSLFALPSSPSEQQLNALQAWLSDQLVKELDDSSAPWVVLTIVGSSAAFEMLLDRVTTQDIDLGLLEVIALAPSNTPSPNERPFRVQVIQDQGVSGWQQAFRRIGKRPWVVLDAQLMDRADALSMEFRRKAST